MRVIVQVMLLAEAIQAYLVQRILALLFSSSRMTSTKGEYFLSESSKAQSQ